MSSVVCYLHKSALTFNFIISIGLLTLLSVDRYIALVKNAWQNIRIKQRPPRVAHCYALLIWIIGILLSLPNIIVIRHEYTFIGNGTYEQKCYENWKIFDTGSLSNEANQPTESELEQISSQDVSNDFNMLSSSISSPENNSKIYQSDFSSDSFDFDTLFDFITNDDLTQGTTRPRLQ